MEEYSEQEQLTNTGRAFDTHIISLGISLQQGDVSLWNWSWSASQSLNLAKKTFKTRLLDLGARIMLFNVLCKKADLCFYHRAKDWSLYLSFDMQIFWRNAFNQIAVVISFCSRKVLHSFAM